MLVAALLALAKPWAAKQHSIEQDTRQAISVAQWGTAASQHVATAGCQASCSTGDWRSRVRIAGIL